MVDVIELECIKDSMYQSTDGSWIIKFKIHPDDLGEAIVKMPKGQRVMLVVAMIDDHEEIKHGRSFDTLSPGEQAHILSKDKSFHDFILNSTRWYKSDVKDISPKEIMDYIHVYLRTSSMKDLNQDQRNAWVRLLKKYHTYKLEENSR